MSVFCLQKGVRELGGHSGRWGDSAGLQGTCTHVDAEVDDKLWVFLLLWPKAGVGEVTPVEGPRGGAGVVSILKGGLVTLALTDPTSWSS